MSGQLVFQQDFQVHEKSGCVTYREKSGDWDCPTDFLQYLPGHWKIWEKVKNSDFFTVEIRIHDDKKRPVRCGKCDACKHVEASKKVLMPNPPFEHADSLTVETWNKVLKDNPCKEWAPLVRCGKCDACKHVEASKKVLLPSPPFEHADVLIVETWKKVLKDNPCEEWTIQTNMDGHDI